VPLSFLRTPRAWCASTVLFVSPLRDPGGYVTSEKTLSSFNDPSKLLRMPSKYAVQIVQAFTTTDPSVKIQSDQWEEQPNLDKHTDWDDFPPVARHDLGGKVQSHPSCQGKFASCPPHFDLDFSDTRDSSSWTTDFKASRCDCASCSANSPCTTLTRQGSKYCSPLV
jgi:hypothetical protein